MTSKDQKCIQSDEEAASESATLYRQFGSVSTSNKIIPTESDDMKRAAAKKLIERYFYQIMEGCGDSECDNDFCASSGKVKNMSANQAAALAIRYFTEDARLCDAKSNKVPRTHEENPSESTNKPSSTAATDIPKSPQNQIVKFLNEEVLVNLVNVCKVQTVYSPLIRTIGFVYSRAEYLMNSFLKEKVSTPLDDMLSKAPYDLKKLKKEDLSSMGEDLDKDEDSRHHMDCGESSSVKTSSNTSKTELDLESLRRSYDALFQVENTIFERSLSYAVQTLSDNIGHYLRTNHAITRDPNFLNIFIIILEIPILSKDNFVDDVLQPFCRAAANLPLKLQAGLAKLLSKHCKDKLKSMVEFLHQVITVRIVSGTVSRSYCVNDDDIVAAATKLLKVIFYATILSGELDPQELRLDLSVPHFEDDFSFGETSNDNRQIHQDSLGIELDINVLDSRKPLFPLSEFYNELLSDTVEMDKDFSNYKNDEESKFSFMNYSFILSPYTKSLGLYYDNRVRMYSERRFSILQSYTGIMTPPYLRLKVKRDKLIEDALVELEVVAMSNPKDLKKQLVVEFDGEQGIDEGGVSKEFFQLVVEEIFNPDYGMFTNQQETQTTWFNPNSFENEAQFTLIGIVLGLAIYNNVILDIQFPMVVYSKLMGKKGCFHDLADWNPTMYQSLLDLLMYEGEDIDEVFNLTFRVCTQDAFGTVYNHDLKPEGDQILVNHINRKEFVDLYADFLLNKSVEKQFQAFRRGFHMVTDESPLHLLFRPEEVEQLVCGSKNFDFNELERSTEYDGGYSPESELIKNFWDVVHKMCLDGKRKLLQFATGSDRVPVGGLSKLKLIIARNGPDSDRLPTAHTCFNVLLIPEYLTREKLEDRLTKAINYSKGFGML